MRDAISQVRFTPASSALRATGLCGWVALRYGDLLLDGLALRRALDGRYVVSFPKPHRRSGNARPVIAPARPDVRTAIEAQVTDELRRQGVIP